MQDNKPTTPQPMTDALQKAILKLNAAQVAHPNAVLFLIDEAIEALESLSGAASLSAQPAPSGLPRPLDPNALSHAINVMPWRDEVLTPDRLREFAEQLWLQFCSVTQPNLSDKAVQKRLAAQWGYVESAQPAQMTDERLLREALQELMQAESQAQKERGGPWIHKVESRDSQRRLMHAWQKAREALSAAPQPAPSGEPVMPKINKRMEYAAQDEFHILPPRLKRLWKRMGELADKAPQAPSVPDDVRKDAERWNHAMDWETKDFAVCRRVGRTGSCWEPIKTSGPIDAAIAAAKQGGAAP